MDAVAALHLTLALAGVGAWITALEALWLVRAGQYGRAGAWPWFLVKVAISSPSIARLPVAVIAAGDLTLAVARLAGASWLIAVLAAGYEPLAPLVVLVGAHVLTIWRTRWGGEGGDQMMLIVFVTGLFASRFRSHAGVQTACALFVAGQITLAYVASGTAKCFGPLWRSGDALSRIMSHYTYGWQPLATFLVRRPWLGRRLSHAVIGFQLTFPLFFLVPMPWALGWLVAGAAFHVAIALVMRLNLFVPVFIGTYPCLLFAHGLLHTSA